MANYIYISEWLPNPKGADAKGEWIELGNNSSESIDISRWRIQTENGKSFVIPGGTRIDLHGYLLLPKGITKLSLRNSDGALSLYDARGSLVDSASFLGSAPEEKSVSRNGDVFLFASPSPGRENDFSGKGIAMIEEHLPSGTVSNTLHFVFQGIVGAMVVGILLAIAAIFFVQRNEHLSELFFSRD